MPDQKFRLVTRSDFDGLVCAALLKELDLIDDILFVHPKDMQDGKVVIGPRDITTNLPYVAGAHLVFDHHLSETLRNGQLAANHVIVAEAPSAARVVYEHFGGAATFPRISQDMMVAVDKADSAAYSLDDVLRPEGWTLLNFLMDARTGLGRFRDFRVSNYQLMMQLIDYCREHSIEQILQLPDVVERVALFREHEQRAIEQIRRCASVRGKVVVLDLRGEDIIWAANRFMIYALFPQCSVSVHVMWGLKQQNTVLAVGKSIIDRSASANVGELCLRHGGGGHRAAGTCQVAHDRAEQVLGEIIQGITAADARSAPVAVAAS
ncbi:MAG: exopolyphosphatase [Burkholderiales bacterium]|jgi:nanoRNase/pAp phosphatase (c-di-AMP/oligoRNAs hydrolase)